MKQNQPTDPRTVYVRGISYSTSDTSFADFFSAIGPTKQAFLVKNTAKQGGHKGFGFVQYALEEDAERAVQQLNGRQLDGKKLKVEIAVKRAPMEERKNKRKRPTDEQQPQNEDDDEEDTQHQQPQKQSHKSTFDSDGEEEAHETSADEEEEEAEEKPATKPAPAPQPKAVVKPTRTKTDPKVASEKHALVRTIAIGGINSPKSLESALDLASKAGKIEKTVTKASSDLVQHYKLTQDGCTGSVALVTYTTVKEAFAAVAALHGQPFFEGGSSSRGKNAAAGQQQAPRIWARQLSGEGLHIKRWRVVVRNLAFTATEADLRDAFTPAGFVWDVTLPRGPTGAGRGFAFVAFQCKADAEKAIKLVNATKIGKRPVAVDWAVSKRQYESGGGAGGGKEEVEGGDSKEPQAVVYSEDDDDDEDKVQQGNKKRIVPGQDDVDSEDADLEPEAEKERLHGVLDGILGDDSDSDDDNADNDGEDHEDEDDDSDFELHSDEDVDDNVDVVEQSDDDDDEEQEEEERPNKVDMLSKSALATTSLQKPAAALDRLEQQSRRAEAKLAGGYQNLNTTTAAVGTTQQLPTSNTEHTVFVRGLPLDIVKDQLFTAMKAYGYVRSCRLVMDKQLNKPKGTAFVEFGDRPAAEAAAQACAKGRQGNGPGVVVAGRKVDVDLALGGEDVRKLAFQKAEQLYKGSGGKNLHLLKEGLIEEEAPAWEEMSDADRAKRKRAVEEAKVKLRSPNFAVSTTRLSVRNIPRSWTEKQLKDLFISAVKERASKANPKILQAKVLTSEPTAENAVKRSKGIGFIEFSEHEHALVALRQLNNNPKAWGGDQRPIVEFAIDDVRIMRQREARKVQAKGKPPKNQQQQQTEEEDAAAPTTDAKPEGGKQRSGRTTTKTTTTATPKTDAVDEMDVDTEAVAAATTTTAPKSKRKLRNERRTMLQERAKEQAAEKQHQPAKANGTTTTAAADVDDDGDGGAAAGNSVEKMSKSKAKRRREQRASKRREATETKAVFLPGDNKQKKSDANAVVIGTKAGSKAKPTTTKTAAAAVEKQTKGKGKRVGAAAVAEAAPAQKKRKKDGKDKLDSMVDDYLKKFIGGGGSEKKESGGEGSRLKRWFE